jgi:hypothetical protein
MSYRIAGIDVHKKMLAVVVSDVEIDGEHQFERRMFGSNPEQLRRWQHGCPSKRPRKWSWNRRPNIGNQSGRPGLPATVDLFRHPALPSGASTSSPQRVPSGRETFRHLRVSG